MQHVEVALQDRLHDLLPQWTGQADILRQTGQVGIEPDVRRRMAALRTLLPNGAATANAVLMGFSSGARVASTFAALQGARGVIALGYPFRMPKRVIEPDRWSHLPHVKVPTLILQGVRDAFGGIGITEDYRFSDSVVIRFLDTDHNFGLSPAAWDNVAQEIRSFLEGVQAGTLPAPLPFDEAFYMNTYRDVAEAVRDGTFASGEAHFRRYGRAEGRLFRYLPDLPARDATPARAPAQTPATARTATAKSPRPTRRPLSSR